MQLTVSIRDIFQQVIFFNLPTRNDSHINLVPNDSAPMTMASGPTWKYI